MGQQAMSEKSETESRVRSLAQARGLDRALALDPAMVAAAVARGAISMSALPAEFSTVTEPAGVFDPEKITESK
jgi:hypothetical protein